MPGVYTQIVPPNNPVINGIPTNNLGIVGTASWGPVNAPTDVGTLSQEVAAFGPMIARKHDLGTAVYAAMLQGANNITCVRVTDGTDAAATAAITATGTAITFTAKYSGSFGNSIQVSIGNGSAANTSSLTVSAPGLPAEKYDNIGGTGNALWVAMAAAVNSGLTALRGPSNLIIATAGSGTGAPTLGSTTLTGGLDGATVGTGNVKSATLVGSDVIPRTGMYALRGQGCSVIVLADADDSTQWTLQSAFGLSEGVYVVGTTPSGDTISNAVSTLATAGVDSYGFKLMLGDWCLISDQTNGVQRAIAPSGFVGGAVSVLGPQYSTLNYQIQGIVGTQKSISGTNYSNADIQALELGRIDVIANPSPGGSYFSCQTGHNTSSNGVIHGDNYTRMTNYIATSITGSFGQFIGKLNTPTLRSQVKATTDTYFLNMQTQGQIADWQAVCDGTNNPLSRVSQGYLQEDIQVQYLSVVEKILVNLQGGQSVIITRVSTSLAA